MKELWPQILRFYICCLFFLCHLLRKDMYQSSPRSIQQLKVNIENAMNSSTMDTAYTCLLKRGQED